jgi:2-(1,2-epoxy-1,2-dihydrophenyl)acetyl-CoA isomerase
MPDVVVNRRGTVAVIAMHRPDRANAIGGTLMKDLLEAVEAADADPGVGAIVTTGSGRAYCVGADFAELRGLVAAGAVPLRLDQLGVDGIGGAKGLAPMPSSEDTLGIGRWTERFLAVRKPTVAAINGGAGGGGLAIALLNDARIAARGARLAFGWAAIGIGPEMGVSWLLPRLVGGARAFELLTRTAPLEAEEAESIGLVDQVVEPGELLDAALAAAERLGAISPDAYVAVKTLVRESYERTLREQLEREWAAQTQLFASDRVSGFLADMVQ